MIERPDGMGYMLPRYIPMYIRESPRFQVSTYLGTIGTVYLFR